MSVKSKVLAGLISLTLYLTPYPALTYTTNSMFLIIMDGTRNQEAFEDSSHVNIPHIWNDLRPQGTIYTNFFTMVQPLTTVGHVVLLSGVRTEMYNNDSEDAFHYRSHYPTIFEYFRRSKGLPADSVWIVSGNDNLSTCDYSLHPAYGDSYGATILIDFQPDTSLFERVIDIIENHHPRLMLINLKGVDFWGHHGTYEQYTEAIQTADSLVFELYNFLQSDEFYTDRATMFITTDHGRVDDLYGGYQNHGLGTHGDRSCFFVALGPDIKQGKVVNDFRTFIDVAPTVGELLDFDTPFAEGRVLEEMFINYSVGEDPTPSPIFTNMVNLSNSPGASVFPSIAVSEDSLYVMWSEEDLSSQNENRQILYSTSGDSGNSWSVPKVIFENPQTDGTVSRGELISGEGAGLIATVNGYYGRYDQLSKRTYKWFVGYSINSNGIEWTSPCVLQDYSSYWRTIIQHAPRSIKDSQNIYLAWSVSGDFVASRSTDDGNRFETVFDYRRPGSFPREYYSSLDISIDSEKIYYAVARNRKKGSDLFVLPVQMDTLISDGLFRIDPDSTGSYKPSLGIGNGALHIVWCDLSEGFSGIYHRKSVDGGVSFSSPVLLSEPGIDGWNPDLSVNGDTLVAVWEDYRDGRSEIYSRWSIDAGGSWGNWTAETSTEGLSVHPRVDSDGNNFFLVWQDRSSGNWEILLMPLSIEP